jgi:hypothetical protein
MSPASSVPPDSAGGGQARSACTGLEFCAPEHTASGDPLGAGSYGARISAPGGSAGVLEEPLPENQPIYMTI